MIVSILGSGSMGTALAQHLARNGHIVNLWVRRKSLYTALKETYKNKDYFPEYSLNRKISFYNKISESIKNANVIVFAVPSHAMYDILNEISLFDIKNKIFLSVIKGLHYPPIKRISELIVDFLGNVSVAVLSGPNIAEEVLKGLPTTTTIAGNQSKILKLLYDLFNSDTLKVNLSDDLIGTELAGSLKNVITIGVGIIDGLNLGENIKGVVVSEGFKEISNIILSMGGKKETIYSPAGIQDLLVASYSGRSRNYNMGKLIALGYKLEEILQKFFKVTYEGYKIVKIAYELSKENGLYSPLIDSIYAVMHKNIPPKEFFKIFWEKYEVDKLD